jgi:hypothetical protein
MIASLLRGDLDGELRLFLSPRDTSANCFSRGYALASAAAKRPQGIRAGWVVIWDSMGIGFADPDFAPVQPVVGRDEPTSFLFGTPTSWSTAAGMTEPKQGKFVKRYMRQA